MDGKCYIGDRVFIISNHERVEGIIAFVGADNYYKILGDDGFYYGAFNTEIKRIDDEHNTIITK